MDKYEGLEYVKTDLVKSKGIIYVKFRLASSALKAKEDIEKNNYMVRNPLRSANVFVVRTSGIFHGREVPSLVYPSALPFFSAFVRYCLHGRNGSPCKNKITKKS